MGRDAGGAADLRRQSHRLWKGIDPFALRADMERDADLPGSAPRMRGPAQQGRRLGLAGAELAAEIKSGHAAGGSDPKDGNDGRITGRGGHDLVQFVVMVEGERADAK